ncbi:GNAT family N-acetyltransferase [Pyxidicoccus xibeiensis]|uniref:GNAT family N-acetyltransferase n=1 Tax=Pyxidicoccus xibeiensis TaxID=2906759 RepID=UPI0020A74E24|nr:GNAT family N-acetyltransferase [Pyxidicoccus xibeiensis]MCP3144226.1 GNAT family N-acetyltransferase [Pyxidicoccus xibeiensis]
MRLFAELGVEDPPPPEAVWAAELAPMTVFAEGPEGQVVAYAAADPMGELGYVGQLVVDPRARGQGLGRWMMERLAERLRGQGCQRWALMVKRDNATALGLYTSVGMRRVREGVTLKVTRAHLATLPPAPAGLDVVPAAPADWAPLTAAFGMMPGKLARFATRASHQLLRLAQAGTPGELGMMDLRAGARLLFPFFAVSPGHARALLESAFARMGDGVDALTVVLADDARLEGLLREAGAHVCHETYELRGPLPGLPGAGA